MLDKMNGLELEENDLEDVNGGLALFNSEDRQEIYNRVIRFAKAHYSSRIDAKTEELLKELIIYKKLYSDAKNVLNEKGINVDHIMRA